MYVCMYARAHLHVGGEVVGGEAAAAEVDDLHLEMVMMMVVVYV